MRNDYYPEEREESEEIKKTKIPIDYADNFETFDRYLDSMYGSTKYGDYY